MLTVFTSYFTPGYADEATALLATLDALGLTHDVRPLAERGSWLANSNAKPSFIASVMDSHPGARIVWTDADARVLKSPDLLLGDLGAYDLSARESGQRKGEYYATVLGFEPTPAARAFLDAWAKLTTDGTQEETTFATALAQGAPRVRSLPSSYGTGFDAATAPDAVIRHTSVGAKKRTCSHPGCSGAGIVRHPTLGWAKPYCIAHAAEAI